MNEPAWEDDHMCFACGKNNPLGLHLDFTPFGGTGLQSEYTPAKEFQGYRNVVHGGFIGLLLDEVMVNLPWKREQHPVVSAEITVRLHQPAPVGEALVITALPDGEPRKNLIPIKGEVRLKKDGTLIATGWAKCVRVKLT
jgi:acyl-coenzyme A thioesterase PaaI-like protein